MKLLRAQPTDWTNSKKQDHIAQVGQLFRTIDHNGGDPGVTEAHSATAGRHSARPRRAACRLYACRLYAWNDTPTMGT